MAERVVLRSKSSHEGDKTKSETARVKTSLSTYKKRFNSAYRYLLEAGMLESDIAAVFGMGKSKYSMDKAKEKDADVMKAYEDGMSALENTLTSCIVSQAIGYDYTEEKITYKREGSGKKKKWVEDKKEVSKKHNSGSPQMMTFLMTNKFGDNWKQTRELVTKKEGYDSNPKDRHRKQIESLATDVLEADTTESEGQHKLSDKPTPVSS